MLTLTGRRRPPRVIDLTVRVAPSAWRGRAAAVGVFAARVAVAWMLAMGFALTIWGVELLIKASGL